MLCQDRVKFPPAGTEVTNRWAPEHLEVLVANPQEVVPRLQHYGGLFVGNQCAEVRRGQSEFV